MNKSLKCVIAKPFYFLLLTIATFWVLSVVFVSPIEFLSGEMASQWNWFSQTGILFSCIISCLVCFNTQGKSCFPNIVSWILIVIGGIEAVWGLGQLYGLILSNHTLYSMTGTFPNPGPFSGYLAMIFPLCLNEYFYLRVKRIKSKLEQCKYYLVTLVILLIICVLPAGMSRSAWIATLISTIYICVINFSWFDKLKLEYQKSKKKVTIIIFITFIILILGAIFTFHIKKNSAYGRLFMWKISCLAILEKPLDGYGINNFPMAYGMAQETYFSQGEYSPQEELVAGSPEYAFNEYLQIAIEWGVPVLICTLSFIGLCLWKGIKQNYTGISGAIISLLVFGSASYPMQLPAFNITLIFLLSLCLIGQSKLKLLIFAIIIGGGGVYCIKMSIVEECRQWASCRALYRAGLYSKAVEKYEMLYPKLKNRAIFMYEYGHTLHKLEQYNASTEKMKEASKLSCDPMILNIMGLNYQNKGEYSKAEELFIRSTHLLPGRLYPYYLLTKLYALPSFYHKSKMIKTANIVLYKKPKVPSKKIDSMRDEIQSLLKY